jgi:hypothetical protein
MSRELEEPLRVGRAQVSSNTLTDKGAADLAFFARVMQRQMMREDLAKFRRKKAKAKSGA